MTVASVWPMPGTLVSKRYCGRGLTRSCRRSSRCSICDCSVAMTATLALIAKPTSAARGRLSIASFVSRLIWLLVIRPPSCRAMMFSTARTCAVHDCTSCMRLRARSRTARCALGRIVPVGRIPNRSRWARCCASVSSPLCFSPSYCLIAAVGEMHVESGLLQPVNQPIPVVGRLDHDAGQFALPTSQKADDLRDVVRQALLRHNPVGIVDNRDNAVVGMQINPAVHHLRLLVVKVIR